MFILAKALMYTTQAFEEMGGRVSYHRLLSSNRLETMMKEGKKVERKKDRKKEFFKAKKTKEKKKILPYSGVSVTHRR